MVGVPSIQGSLHSSFGEIQLVVAGFTIASAVCGAAPDAPTLICSRVVQGMCSGLMFPQVLSIIQVVFGKP